MNYCTNCGAGLGLGRFCTNCGAPVAPPAERTAPRPTVAPDAASGSRYPLFADQVGTSVRGWPAVSEPVSAPPPPVAPPLAPLPTPSPHRGRRGNGALWILLLLVAMLAAAVIGVWLATRGSDDGEPGGSPDRSPSVTQGGGSGSDQPELPGAGIDLSEDASVDGPEPVRPGVDLAGNPVTYPASNLLDDDTETAYRMPGDATGAVIRFALPEEGTVTAVGLVNGYAKSDSRGGRTVDWYAKNRRVLKVEWRFDDGTTVVQDLLQNPRLQVEEIPAEVTSTIELRILEVSPPGTGALAKNVTAISDVLIHGS